MALFGKKQKEAVPAELEAFYEREPAGKRWARRILAIIIIVALVAGLAWAAMKVYEQVTNRDVDMDNKGPETAQQDTQGATDTTEGDDDAAAPSEDPAKTEQEGATSGTATDQPAAPTTGSTDDQAGKEGVVDSGAVSTTNDENLPSTGPADVLWVIFGAVTVGALGYQIKLRRQQ